MKYKTRNEDEGGSCLECGKALYGRHDKKFCTDRCRNSYHNARTGTLAKQKRRAYKSLETNYRILSNILMSGGSSATLEELEAAGYSDGMATGMVQCGPHTAYACFDILFSRSKTRIFQIRRRAAEDEP